MKIVVFGTGDYYERYKYLLEKENIVCFIDNDKTKEGVFSVDKTGKKSGRGAYMCDSESCMQKILTKKLLARAFSMEIPQEVYDAIRSEFFAEK